MAAGTGRPTASSPSVAARMSRQARAHTAPELLLRRRLHAMGLRYRVGLKVPGMPRCSIDIAFTRARLAVFVDGCFWHSCPEHATHPSANGIWWATKLTANQVRDRRVEDQLADFGWAVLRVWEHENPDDAARRVASALQGGAP